MTANAAGTLEHDALFYTDAASYRSGCLEFVRAGLEHDEPVLVAVPQPGLGLLARRSPRTRPRGYARRTCRRRGATPGGSSARCSPRSCASTAGQRVRIIGEPIWAGRSEDEYPACAEHEALINVALGEAPAYVLCPYDVRRLEREWLTDATRTHPTLAADGDRWESPAYTDPVALAA